MSSSDIEIHAEDLRQIASVLDDAGSALFDRAPELETSPDAGASSGEMAKVMVALSSAVAGLAQHLADLSASTAANAADFAGTDQAVAGGMQQRQWVLRE